MKRLFKHTILIVASVATAVLAGCTERSGGETPDRKSTASPTDTLYTVEKALKVYDYQPERALRILDSAVVVGNIDTLRANSFRARIYSWTRMGQQMDSLLRGPEGVRFDSARVIGERLLGTDTVKANLGLHQDILEVLVYTARQQKDTTRWLSRSRELVDVCHAQGAETEALRTEAEVGAVLCSMGRREQGMARLDSVINLLDRSPAGFNELDALVIAMKRKISVLCSEEKIVETIPLANRIVGLLDDYEQHPANYHDGTYREPKDSTQRTDYIRFYRSQAQSLIAAAYASLGELGSMDKIYKRIEQSMLEATAREHIARYKALEQEMLREKAESRRHFLAFVANALVVGVVLLLLFSSYVYFQNRKMRRKNRVLARMIKSLTPDPSAPSNLPPKEEAIDVTCGNGGLLGELTSDSSPLGGRLGGGCREGASGGPSFADIDTCIRSERLYANANIQRQDICDRFGLRREVLNQLLSDHADGASFPTYINGIRLSEACRLLSEEQSKTVNAIAEEVGLSPRNLRRLFVEQYGMTPTEYRQELKNSR